MRLLCSILVMLAAALLKQDTPAAVFPFGQKYVATSLNDEPFVGIVRYRQWERKSVLFLKVTVGSNLWSHRGAGSDGCNAFGLESVVVTSSPSSAIKL